MKKICFKLSLILIAVAALSISGCKKDNSTTDDSLSAKDAASISNVQNANDDDATNAASQVSSLSGKTSGVIALNALCGAVVTDTSGQELTLSYNGSTNCEGVLRNGTITVALSGTTHWKDQGAVLNVTVNMQFTDVATLGTYTVTGTYAITNETGGLAYNVFVNGASGPVAHRHTGNMQITFPNGAQRTWTFDRTRTYTKTSTNLVNIALSAEASGNVSATGLNRFGNTFTNSIPTPIQATNNSGCAWKPWAGQYIHKIENRTATINYGVDNNDNPVGAQNTCTAADGYFITYQSGTHTLVKFVEYWQ